MRTNVSKKICIFVMGFVLFGVLFNADMKSEAQTVTDWLFVSENETEIESGADEVNVILPYSAPTGIFFLQNDHMGVKAGITTTEVSPKSDVEYSWYAIREYEENEECISDWKYGNEWLDWIPEKYGNYTLIGRTRVNGNDETIEEVKTDISYSPHIKGKCQMPYTGEGGGYLIGFETYDNPGQKYRYEVLILDCTLLAQGKDAWIYTTTQCGVAEGNAFWTIWQPKYGYYWTLFRLFDENGNLIDEQCYGFQNIVENQKWVLTQYADDSGQQGMFYTLKNTTNGELIVIDGGNPENEQQVRTVIKEEGGVVTAWLLTHYHPDHIGAFNTIYQKPQGIVINSIYATPYNYELFTSVAKWWDGIETFRTFVEATEGDSRVNYITRDSVLEYKDMSITFFNCFDEKLLEQKTGDIFNNSSLVFKVVTGENSVLFCGDCDRSQMADLLIGRYGEDLRADYVQLGHHGNAGLPTWFYDMVQPKTVFFDAPEWLMTGEKYDAKELRDYFRKQGIICYDFTTAPNRILLY